MLFGKSILHVKQNQGRVFDPKELRGYFNDLTKKVTKDKKIKLTKGYIPTIAVAKNQDILFPVAIFQYGLGCYDLYLINGKTIYRDKFLELSDWAVEHQEKDGGWNNFWYIYPDTPYGAMCQGEGASLLIRAFKETQNEKYLISAKKALDFMLLNKKNPMTLSNDGELVLLEYENKSPVLNGWIFASFGLYDVWLSTKDEKYHLLFVKTIDTLKKYLASYDNSYWSMYDLGGKIASPFYHNLHIAQLKVLYLVTQKNLFLNYCKKFKKYKNNIFNRLKAFFVKANQKIKE